MTSPTARAKSKSAVPNPTVTTPAPAAPQTPGVPPPPSLVAWQEYIKTPEAITAFENAQVVMMGGKLPSPVHPYLAQGFAAVWKAAFAAGAESAQVADLAKAAYVDRVNGRTKTE